MSQNFDNELLSAMHDGELSPEEQTRLQKQISDSEQLGSEAAELQRLSALIANIPTEPAPPDLAQKVMAHVILATPPVTTVTAPNAPTWKRWSGVAALLTAAVALFLMFRLTGPGHPEVSESMVNQAAAPMPQSIAADSSADDDHKMTPPAASRAAKILPSVHAMTEQIAGGQTTVIEVDSRETDVAVLLQTLFRAEMLEHRQSDDKALGAAGLEAIVVQVDTVDVSSILTKVEALAGPDSLSVKRDTDPESLRQKLLLAESLYEERLAPSDSKLRAPSAIARNLNPPTRNRTARDGQIDPPIPKPARAELQKSDVADDAPARNQGTPQKIAGTPPPSPASDDPVAAAEEGANARLSQQPGSFADTDAQTTDSVKVIFVMKKVGSPTDENIPLPCDDLNAA